MSLIDLFYERTYMEFDFLTKEFGAKRRKPRSSAGTHTVTYENDTTGAEVGLEWRDQFLYVSLYRLDWEPTGWSRASGSRTGYSPHPSLANLHDLISIRAPDELPERHAPGEPLTAEAIERTLAQYARLLQGYGADVIGGDFSIFPSLWEIVKRRAEELRRAGFHVGIPHRLT